MLIDPHDLARQLEKRLLPVYLVCGDEPLQSGEAADCIRRVARQHGYLNRMRLNVDAQFDWNQLRGAVQTQSLFAERNLIELHWPSAKPGKEGTAALDSVVPQCGENDLLLIISGKLPPRSNDTTWYKCIDRSGGIVQVWPLDGPKLAFWLKRRLQDRGLEVDPAGIEILAQRVEGNLLAAAQEIDKLQVLHGSGRIAADQILDAVADSARFDVFKLVDSLLAGQLSRSLQILEGLKSERTPAPVILWALAREIRLLAQLSHSQHLHGTTEPVFKIWKTWQKRKGLYLRALQRHPVSVWYELLQQCAWIDRCVKGLETGDPWNRMAQICECLCATDHQPILMQMNEVERV